MYLWTSVFFPAMIGNVWGFMMPSKITNYISNGITLLVIESYYRCGDSYVWQTINRSKLCRTGLFMTFSALILETHNRLLSKHDIIWFIKTPPKNENLPSLPDDDDPPPDAPTSPIMNALIPTRHLVCLHNGSCDSYIMKGIKSNLKLGIVIEVARTLFANMQQLQATPLKVFGLLAKMKLGLVMFLVSYTTSYRVSCVNKSF